MTGDFSAAFAGSLVIDLDHMISYFRHGILFSRAKLFKALTDEVDQWGDQRNFLHSIYSWFFISALLFLMNRTFGFVFSIAYFFHLVLDAMDSAVYYPLFPSKKFLIKGFVKYYSKQEIIFDVCLLIFALWIKNN